MFDLLRPPGFTAILSQYGEREVLSRLRAEELEVQPHRRFLRSQYGGWGIWCSEGLAINNFRRESIRFYPSMVSRGFIGLVDPGSAAPKSSNAASRSV